MKWFLNHVFDVIKIRASFEGRLISAGTWIIVATGAVQILSVTIPTEYGELVFSAFPDGEPSYWPYGVGVLLIGFGLFIGIRKMFRDERASERQLVLSVELRGLQENSDTPLANYIPKDITGYRDALIVDIRKFIERGIVRDPNSALSRINLVPHDLLERIKSKNRGEVSIFLGGLIPVPFGFLTGVLLDDEHRIEGLMDWDRDTLIWRSLDADDDGNRFEITGLKDIPHRTSEVIVAVSASYGIDLEGVRQFKSGLPIIELKLTDKSTSCHWSLEKQHALCAQFREMMVQLANKKIGLVHIFMAGASSLVIRLGQSFDKRLMPPSIVYQYERSVTPPYPWGVRLPTHGVENPEIV